MIKNITIFLLIVSLVTLVGCTQKSVEVNEPNDNQIQDNTQTQQPAAVDDATAPIGEVNTLNDELTNESVDSELDNINNVLADW